MPQFFVGFVAHPRKLAGVFRRAFATDEKAFETHKVAWRHLDCGADFAGRRLTNNFWMTLHAVTE
jgi:hypothetical protein